VHWGKLKLKTIALEKSGAASVEVVLDGRPVAGRLERKTNKANVILNNEVEISAGQKLQLKLT